MRGIAWLARELGISTGTVSRALNGKPDVNEATRRRVLEAAQRLGYAPNQAARALAQGMTRSVGFMIELDQESTASTDYFFMGVFDGVQHVLAKHGLDLLVLPCASSQDHYTYLERFVSRSAVDGMILAATRTIDRRIELLQSAKIPFVTLGRSDTGSGYSWIDLDFEGSVATAIDRFVQRGHRRIAVTVPHGEVNFGAVFKRAYQDNLARHGIDFDPALIFVTRRQEDVGDAIVDNMLANPEPPTAVLLIYEVTAIGIYRRLRELGLEPGRDFAVVSFRDEPTVRFLAPSMTCFHVSLQELGMSLAHALLPQIPLRGQQSSQSIVQSRAPMTLVPGESDACDPVPVDRLLRRSNGRNAQALQRRTRS